MLVKSKEYALFPFWSFSGVPFGSSNYITLVTALRTAMMVSSSGIEM